MSEKGERVRERTQLQVGSVDNAFNVVLIRAGVANGLAFGPELLDEAASRFAGAPCYVDHEGPAKRHGVRDLVGLIAEPAYDPVRREIRARLALGSSAGWLREMIGDFGPYERVFGLSADLWIRREGERVTEIDAVNSVDIVVNPAAGGRFITQKEQSMQSKQSKVEQVQEGAERVHLQEPDATDESRDTLASEVAALAQRAVQLKLAISGLPEVLQDQVQAAYTLGTLDLEQVDGQIDRLKAAWAEAQAQGSIRGLGGVGQMRTGLDRLTLAFERLMGLPEQADHRDVARLTGVRELYDLLTGDWDRHGRFYPERVSLANVTTTTMAQVTADVLNKVLLRAFEARRWWAPIVYEQDFTTMHDAKWITLGGISDLDTVAEGDPYTEKTWDDSAETSSFVKKGNYVGITLEMIDRDDVAAVRAIPRRLGVAANRTLSSAVAALFTANADVGPLLADGVNLFDAAHGNLGNTALDADAWDAAIQAVYKQAEFHSSKRLGVRPSWCLVPIELEKTALTVFTTDLEPGTTNNDRNVRRSSGRVITVPEWTDANNWAAACDPGDLEGVCVGYRFGRAPEIFVADDGLTGSMFTSDEMRLKVRFVYAVGVGDYRALYKANVA